MDNFESRYQKAIEDLPEDKLAQVEALNPEQLRKWVDSSAVMKLFLLRLWARKRIQRQDDDDAMGDAWAKACGICLGFINTLILREGLFRLSEEALSPELQAQWRVAKERWALEYDVACSLINMTVIEGAIDTYIGELKNYARDDLSRKQLDSFMFKNLMHAWLRKVGEDERKQLELLTTEEDAMEAYTELVGSISRFMGRFWKRGVAAHGVGEKHDFEAGIKDLMMAVQPILAIAAQIVLTQAWPNCHEIGADIVLAGSFGPLPNTWRRAADTFKAQEEERVGKVTEILANPEKSKR